MPTKSQTAAADITALLKARNGLIWIVSNEETRIEKHLFGAAASANYVARTWDVGQGAAEIDGSDAGIENSADIGEMLKAIRERAENGRSGRGVWIMRDLPAWLTGYPGITTLRQVRNLARLLPGIPRENAQALIVLSPSKEVPPELAGSATVVEWPMPDRAEIATLLDTAIESLPEQYKAGAAPNGTREAAIDAAVGLSGEEAQACYAKSLVQLKRIDPAVIAQEKKRVISKSGVLQWYDRLPGGLESVGGLDNLKVWLKARAAAFTPAAREYGLPPPKGVLLVGVPGCGKTLTGKAVATAWESPLLRMDMGALKSKYVGSSEENFRKAITTIEACGKVVVMLDEIEKMLQGATSGSSDGGVSADALGALLTWMSDRTSPAFVVATANDVTSLPPELMRAGRFDSIWFVDLPTFKERIEVLRAALRSHGRSKVEVDFNAVAEATDSFTGSEIASLVPDAMFTAFADGAREIKTKDLIEAAKQVVPLSETAKVKIAALREWAKGKARPATSPDTETGKLKIARVLDL